MLRVSCAFLGTLLIYTSRASALFMSTSTSPSVLHEAEADRAVRDGESMVNTTELDEHIGDILAQSRTAYELFDGPIRPVGFKNEGSKCYRNVLLQAMLTLPRFVDEVLDHDARTGTIVYSATAFQQFKAMVLKVALGKAFQPAVNSFRGGQEEDVMDYFQKLVLTDLLGFASQFRGTYNIVSRCSVAGCNGCSFEHAQPMRYITLSIDRRDRVSFSLKDWCDAHASVDWDSCDTCGTPSVTATRQQFINDLPDTLVVHCDRFRRHGERLTKNSKTFYPSLELTGEDLRPCMASTAELDKVKYVLSALISHQGWSFSSGHYICYAKHADDWFYCNDSTVYRVNENEVRHNRDAYVLFYIRQDSAEQRVRSSVSDNALPRDAQAEGVPAEAFQLAGDDDPATEHDPTSPPRGDVSTPEDPREYDCSWGSTPPTPQPAQADARHADVVGSR